MIFIALRSKEHIRISLNDIASEIGTPPSFTAKILQKLVHEKLLVSTKGPTGGFVISEDRSAKITLAEIVSAIDGDSVFKGCGLGFRECDSERPCAVHYKFQDVRNSLSDMLENTVLAELTENTEKGLTFLKDREVEPNIKLN